MKKINSLIILLLTFFLCTVTTYAETKNINYGTEYVFIKDKTNLSCTGTLHFLKLKEVTNGYAIVYDKDPTDAVDESVTCTFTVNGEQKSEKYDFHIDAPKDVSPKTAINLNNSFENKKTGNIATMLWTGTSGKVISATTSDSRLSLNCPAGGSGCKVTATEFPASGFTATVTVEFTKGGAKMTGTVTVNVTSSATVRAKMGTYGTCNFGSGWDVTGTNATSKQTGNVSLPSCTPGSKYPLLEFAGWSKGESSTDLNAQLTDTCVSKLVVNGSGTYSTNSAVTLFACYKSVKGVVVVPGSFDISTSGWTQYGNGNYFKKGDSITLPEPTNKKAGNREFKGWREKGTNTIVEGGKTVSGNGQIYTAEYESVQVYDNFNKAIFLNNNSTLKPAGVTVTGCTIVNGDEYIKDMSSDGDCQLYGLKETGANPIEVIVTGTKDGKDYKQTFKITVVNPYNGESVEGSDQFIMNITPNVTPGVSNYTTLNGFQTDSCNVFTYTGSSGETSTGNGEENIFKYNFTPKTSSCNGSGTFTYESYCLDAGRKSPDKPNNMDYERTLDINNDGDYAKLINYMAARGMIGGGAADVTTNFLLRVIGYVDGVTIASDFNSQDVMHADFYQKYADIGSKLLDDNGMERLDSEGNYTLEAIEEVLAAAGGMSIDGTKVTDVLSHYKGDNTSAKSFEREIDEIEYCIDAECTEPFDGSGDEYYVRYTGVIRTTFGEASLGGSLKDESHGVSLVSGSTIEYEGEETLDSGASVYKYNYTIILKVNVGSLRVPKTKDEEKNMSVILSFGAGSGGSNVTDMFIAEATGDDATKGYQRMLMFNTNAERIYVYFSPALNTSFCKDMPALQPGGCSDAASCGLDGDSLSSSSTTSVNGFNPSLFAASGCCNLITNEDGYEFLIDNICSNKCSSTTLTSVCDYRENFTGNQNEVYDVTEMQDRKGNFKIGGYPTCVVNTGNPGTQGDKLTDRMFNKSNENYVKEQTYREDEAGNSLMVQNYNTNRYCRVSCGESWQLTMESYGNYLGANAVAAGSYFQLVNDSMFVSGKRTCFTTFINYGSNVNDNQTNKYGVQQKEINKTSDNGYTKDVTVESDKLTDAYNLFANLSHTYADLACSWDNHGTLADDEVTFWRNACVYNPIRTSYNYFCISATTRYYCAGYVDTYEYHRGIGTDYVRSNSDNGTEYTTPYTCYTRNYKPIFGPLSEQYEDDNDFFSNVGSNTATVTDWYSGYDTAQEAKDAVKAAIDAGTYDQKYKTVGHYAQVLYKDDVHADRWWADQNGSTAQIDGYIVRNNCQNNDGTATDEEDCEVESYRARAIYYFYYDALSYNHCDKSASEDKSKWGVCMVFSLNTTDKFDDGLPHGDSKNYDHKEDTDSHKGQYVGYVLDTKDNRYSTKDPNTSTEDNRSTYSILVDYSKIGYENQAEYGSPDAPIANQAGIGVSNLRTGNFNPDALNIGYVYPSDSKAREALADETTTSTPNAYVRGWNDTQGQNMKKSQNRAYATTYAPDYNYDIPGGDVPGFARYIPSANAESMCKYGITGGYTITVDYAAHSNTENGMTVSHPARSNTYHAADNLYVRYDQWSFDQYRTKKNASEMSSDGTSENSGGTENGNVHETEDTEFGAEIRRTILGYTGIGTQQTDLASGQDTGSTREKLLSDEVDNMNKARSNIISYTEDLYACQHFQLHNVSDDDDANFKNNSLSSSHFLGMRRSFMKINTAFKPDISYTYDEDEYMTIVGDENVMIKFQALNSKYWCDYDMEHRSSDMTAYNCYNQSTNDKKELNTGKEYYSNFREGGAGEVDKMYLFLARNYTETYIYDNAGKAWVQSGEGQFGIAESYGAYLASGLIELSGNGSSTEVEENGVKTKITLYKCSGSDCNIGDESHLQGATYFQRVFFCTIGEVEGIGHVSGSYAKGGNWSYSYTIRNKDAAWTDGECYVVEAQYLRANYVKSSIENSAFFVNRGNWYLKDNDIKAHGDNLKLALENSGYSQDDSELNLWSKLGSYNVFPVKMTTPRGIYTYTYKFSDIGSTSTGQLGRIMGAPSALITKNTRSCFYEVFEDVCLCCGEVIETHVEVPDYETLPKLTITKSEYDTKKAAGELKHYATLGFFPSTISLSEPTKGNVELANNWSENSPVFYNNNVYETDKGYVLLEAMKGYGDNVYDEKADYSYRLTPAMLSGIRDYNDEFGYGVSYDRLEVLGKFAISPFDGDNLLECTDLDSGCIWTVDGSHTFGEGDSEVTDLDEVINFQHYASKFLENELIYRGYDDQNSLIDVTDYSLDESCYVTQEEIKDLDNKAKHDLIKGKVENDGCRWVDYVQISTSIKKYDYQEEHTKILRLSYK